MVITDNDKSLSTFEESKLNYGPGAEARIRLTEGKLKLVVLMIIFLQ
uniref:Vacuolar protein sorting 11 n=1 Tax=Apis cerana TaxID=7461 RepID=V9IF94_APICE